MMEFKITWSDGSSVVKTLSADAVGLLAVGRMREAYDIASIEILRYLPGG
jgi:uncharacterized protein (DUF697 family)